MAGRRSKGATLYLTLEPCVHWGRTAALRRRRPGRRPRAGRRLGRRPESPRRRPGDPPARGGRARRLRRPPRGEERGAQRGPRQVHRPQGPVRHPQGGPDPGREDRLRERRLEMDLLGRDARLRPSPARRTGRPHDRRRHARRATTRS